MEMNLNPQLPALPSELYAITRHSGNHGMSANTLV